MLDPAIDSINHERKGPLGGFIGVIISVVAIFLIVPLFTTSIYAHLALQSCFLLLILSTIRMISLVGFTLILPFLAFDLASIVYNSVFFMVIAYGFYCFFLLYAIIRLSKRVLGREQIDTNLVFAAITVYLLLGVLWAKVYFLEDAFLPNSYRGVTSIDMQNSDLGDGYQAQFDLLYFSFTTLTTLGVGDIVPVHRLAKSLTIAEAIFGQLFIATVMAKLVTIWRNR